MASNFHIQKPYVLASLPRSLAQLDGKCVVGEVFGQRPGVKKRRRAEVAVGIDGESANIYDIASSRLITSYPVPPQAKFSCAPCSVRHRSSAGKDATVARYTYVATREPARKVSLFKDTVEASGTTSSETVTASLGRAGDVVSLHSLSLSSDKPADQTAAAALPTADLLAVNRDGQVTCFDGESLKEKYKVSVAALSQDLVPRGAVLRVEFAQMGLAADVVKGLALGDEYLAGFFSQRIDAENGFNPDVLFVVTAVTGRQTGVTRYLHVLAADPARQAHGGLVQVHHIRLPPSESSTDAPDVAASAAHPTYRLDILSGSLFVLEGDSVLSYDLARSVPRAVSSISIPGVTSFLRLSKSSILAATPSSFSVYNPLFKSLQASTSLDIQSSTKAGESGSDGKAHRACSFVSFFPQLELAVALLDSNLVAVQLEPPRTRSKKRRADGLLIDSIGRGLSYADSRVAGEAGAALSKRYLPGTVSASYLAQFKEDVKSADALLEQKDVTAFDDFLAEKLGIQASADWRWQRPLDVTGAVAEAMDVEAQDGDSSAAAATNGLTNGVAHGPANGLTNGHAADQQPTNNATAAAKRASKYPDADRRWVVYAIGRVLAVDQQQQQRPGGRLRLRCTVLDSDILNYLVDAGHLSVANTRSALREALRDVDEDDLLLGEALPLVLAHVDPSLDLLLRWLYETKLGAAELLSAVLLLMRSLELVDTAPEVDGARLLTNGASEDNDNENDDDNTQELDRLDRQLHLAEYFLQHVESDPRDLALDIAIGKLGSCPAAATVQGLRRVFRTDEIRSLIEVLRKQMVDQGWATRYVDMEAVEGLASEAAPPATPLNYSIRLIADLLCRCIDAVRPGEWLINDAAEPVAAGTASLDLAAGVPAGGDFFALLKWQVSAALEGVQEALYLRGLVGETVRYGLGVQSMAAAAAAAPADDEIRPTRVGALAASSSGVLPLGLKAPVHFSNRHSDVTPSKVVSGGEVVKRSRRELGHLTSKKVGAYTLDRIVL